MADEVVNTEKPKKKSKLIPIVVTNLVVVAVIFYFVNNNASGNTKAAPVFHPTPYYEFSLDKFSFTLPSIGGQFLNDTFQMVVKLSINPTYENVQLIQIDLETRKSYIRDRVYDYLNRLSPEEFMETDFTTKLKTKIKEIINLKVYNIDSFESEIVKEVIIDERVLPVTK